MMVYSIDNQDSFNNIDSWLKEIKNESNPDVKVFLIGNKTDLEEKRRVNKERAEEFANDNKLDLAMETSAKTGFNARNVFIEAAKCLYKENLKYKDKMSRPESVVSNNSHKLPMPQPPHKVPETKKGCC